MKTYFNKTFWLVLGKVYTSHLTHTQEVQKHPYLRVRLRPGTCLVWFLNTNLLTQYSIFDVTTKLSTCLFCSNVQP